MEGIPRFILHRLLYVVKIVPAAFKATSCDIYPTPWQNSCEPRTCFVRLCKPQLDSAALPYFSWE